MPRPSKAEPADDTTGAAAPTAPAPSPTMKPKAPEEPAASPAASPSSKAATPEPPHDPVSVPKGFSIGIPGFRFHGSSPVPDIFRGKRNGG